MTWKRSSARSAHPPSSRSPIFWARDVAAARSRDIPALADTRSRNRPPLTDAQARHVINALPADAAFLDNETEDADPRLESGEAREVVAPSALTEPERITAGLLSRRMPLGICVGDRYNSQGVEHRAAHPRTRP